MKVEEHQHVRMRRIRAVGPEAAAGLNTEERRSAFLVDGLFVPGELHLVQSEIDRMILGGAVPKTPIRLPNLPELGGKSFLDHREVGIISLGPPGVVRIGSEGYKLDMLDCLYVGLGEGEVWFEPAGDSVPQFYLVSCPAARKFPNARVSRQEAAAIPVGSGRNASCRHIYKYIHPDGIRSSQLLMGYTELAEASVWNTTPPHLHERRAEIYLYTGLADDNVVIHLMGRPENSIHLIVRDLEAVLSPPWSIHMGAGTSDYRFIWAMAGENQDFSDVDPLPLSALR
jgi:4-deoxy-L-threo-5-hexosulose-uronate ketol-isomerase